MSWKSTLKSIEVAGRRMERQAIRNQRELEKRQKEYAKMQELERAAHEVNMHENYVERMTSLHKDCGPIYNWNEIAKQLPPYPPVRESKREQIARYNLQSFQPGFFDRIFNITEKKIKTLTAKVELAIREDEQRYQELFGQYKSMLYKYEQEQLFTKNILLGNLEYYKIAINEINPLAEIAEIGSSIGFEFESAKRIKVIINIHGEQVIPRQSKSLLKSGKLTQKDIPQGKYNELYQDYVCSSVLRVGRELFALLPLEEIVITAKGNILNQSNGKLEDQPVLSVLLFRETMSQINFGMIDPSECMKNFKHNMGFKKSAGMSVVAEVY